jgi:hypothetical protein
LLPPRRRLIRLFLNFIANFFHIFADPVSGIPTAHHGHREEHRKHCEHESLYFNGHNSFGLSFGLMDRHRCQPGISWARLAGSSGLKIPAAASHSFWTEFASED